MAVTFYIADNIEEAALVKEPDALHFEDELQIFLCKNTKRTGPEAYLLLGLDPYGSERILNRQEIIEIMETCDLLQEVYEETEVYFFAIELKRLCSKALNKGKNIFALGD
jgi:hypothetical protein